MDLLPNESIAALETLKAKDKVVAVVEASTSENLMMAKRRPFNGALWRTKTPYALRGGKTETLEGDGRGVQERKRNLDTNRKEAKSLSENCIGFCDLERFKAAAEQHKATVERHKTASEQRKVASEQYRQRANSAGRTHNGPESRRTLPEQTREGRTRWCKRADGRGPSKRVIDPEKRWGEVDRLREEVKQAEEKTDCKVTIEQLRKSWSDTPKPKRRKRIGVSSTTLTWNAT